MLAAEYAQVRQLGASATLHVSSSHTDFPSVPHTCKFVVTKQHCHRYLHETDQLVDLGPTIAQHRRLQAEKTRRPRPRGKTVASYDRPSPSAALLQSLAPMRLEAGWTRLESRGAFVVLSAAQPHCFLWATKHWTQVICQRMQCGQ